MEEFKNIIERDYLSISHKIEFADNIYKIIKKIDRRGIESDTEIRNMLSHQLSSINTEVSLLVINIRKAIFDNTDLAISDPDWLLDLTVNRLPALYYSHYIVEK